MTDHAGFQVSSELLEPMARQSPSAMATYRWVSPPWQGGASGYALAHSALGRDVLMQHAFLWTNLSLSCYIQNHFVLF